MDRRRMFARRPPVASRRQRAPVVPAGAHATVEQVLRLQQAAGNQAVVTLLRQPEPAGAAKPKTDKEQWDEDWSTAPAWVRRHFGGGSRPEGTPKERYDVLCPLYKAHGIDRPVQYVKDNIRDATFFGETHAAHTTLKSALEAAEKTLRAEGFTAAPFRKWYAFNPRTTSEGNWSNHAAGKAVDIDEETNERLINKGQRNVITALTGVDVAAADPGAGLGMDAYDASKLASDLFQARYSPEGMEARITELAGEEERLSDEVEVLQTSLAQATKNDAAAIKARLKAKKAELARARSREAVLEKEKARYEKLDADIVKAEDAVDALTDDIEKLDADIAAADKKTRRALVKKRNAKAKMLQKTRRRLESMSSDKLREHAREGFLDLNKQLVEALEGAGLHWGGEGWAAKDYMHFEVP
jgi:hypothetical protein